MYEHRYRSLVGLFEVGEEELIGTHSVHDVMDKVPLIGDRLMTTQSMHM